MELINQEKALLQELILKSIEYNTETFTVFLNFSGHVHWVELTVHYGGYKNNNYASKIGLVHLDKSTNLVKDLQDLIDELTLAYSENEERLLTKVPGYVKAQELKELERLKAKYEGETVNAE